MILATSSDSERRPKEVSLVNCSQPHLGGLASVFCEFLSKTLHERSLYDTRRVGVDGDAVVRKVTGGDLGQAAHGELGGAVEWNALVALDAGLGGGVDDLAAVTELLELLGRSLRAPQDTLVVDVEDLVDFFFGDVLERDLRSDAGVVDDDVEAARLGQDGIYPAV